MGKVFMYTEGEDRGQWGSQSKDFHLQTLPHVSFSVPAQHNTVLYNINTKHRETLWCSLSPLSATLALIGTAKTTQETEPFSSYPSIFGCSFWFIKKYFFCLFSVKHKYTLSPAILLEPPSSNLAFGFVQSGQLFGIKLHPSTENVNYLLRTTLPDHL